MAPLVAPRRRNPIAAEDSLAGWVFVLPALVIFVGFIFGPILYSFWLSFHNWNVVTPEKPFVALDNYRNLVATTISILRCATPSGIRLASCQLRPLPG